MVLLICCVCGLIWLDLGVCGVFLRWLACDCFGKVRFGGRFVRCIVCLFVCAACRVVLFGGVFIAGWLLVTG